MNAFVASQMKTTRMKAKRAMNVAASPQLQLPQVPKKLPPLLEALLHVCPQLDECDAVLYTFDNHFGTRRHGTGFEVASGNGEFTTFERVPDSAFATIRNFGCDDAKRPLQEIALIHLVGAC